MVMRFRTRRYLTLTLFLAVAGVLVYLASAGPVLFSYAERHSLAPQPVWSLLNPLRSRAPERPAEALLRELAAGNAPQALTRLHADPPINPDTIEDEQRLRLVSWRLMSREDLPDRIELLFHGARMDYPDDARRPVWIRLARPAPDGPWKVTSFSAVY